MPPTVGCGKEKKPQNGRIVLPALNRNGRVCFHTRHPPKANYTLHTATSFLSLITFTSRVAYGIII